MMIYGFSSTDVLRGTLEKAEADASDVKLFGALHAAPGEWEYADTRFARVKRELMMRMGREHDGDELVDLDELVRLVRQTRAADVPLVS